MGDHVIIINCNDVILTGNKLNQKVYRHHSGYIGGMKEISAKVMLEKNPEKAMTLALRDALRRPCALHLNRHQHQWHAGIARPRHHADIVQQGRNFFGSCT